MYIPRISISSSYPKTSFSGGTALDVGHVLTSHPHLETPASHRRQRLRELIRHIKKLPESDAALWEAIKTSSSLSHLDSDIQIEGGKVKAFFRAHLGRIAFRRNNSIQMGYFTSALTNALCAVENIARNAKRAAKPAAK